MSRGGGGILTFCRVHKGHGTFTNRIGDSEQIDKQGHEGEPELLAVDIQASPCDKQGPGHIGECGEQERSAAKRVDGKDGGDGKDKIECSETDGSVQRLVLVET